MDSCDIARLRRLLEDYYGSAMFSGFPAAVVDLADVERMSDEEVVRRAQQLGLI